MYPATVLFLVMEVLDCLTTIIGLALFEKQEANPLVHALGLPVVFLIKAIDTIFVAMFLQLRLRWFAPFRALQWFVALIVLFVVVRNIMVILGGPVV